jgi:hypothetical protein
MTPRCEGCRFWDPMKMVSPYVPPMGWCVRYPQEVAKAPQQWCGEYQGKEGG